MIRATVSSWMECLNENVGNEGDRKSLMEEESENTQHVKDISGLKETQVKTEIRESKTGGVIIETLSKAESEGTGQVKDISGLNIECGDKAEVIGRGAVGTDSQQNYVDVKNDGDHL